MYIIFVPQGKCGISQQNLVISLFWVFIPWMIGGLVQQQGSPKSTG